MLFLAWNRCFNRKCQVAIIEPQRRIEPLMERNSRKERVRKTSSSTSLDKRNVQRLSTFFSNYPLSNARNYDLGVFLSFCVCENWKSENSLICKQPVGDSKFEFQSPSFTLLQISKFKFSEKKRQLP